MLSAVADALFVAVRRLFFCGITASEEVSTGRNPDKTSGLCKLAV